MDSSIITALVAVVLIASAWKVFTGIVKTVALVLILGLAAALVFGGVFA